MGILHNHRYDLYLIPTEIQVRDPNLMGLLNPHLFDAGEEGGRFEAQEFHCAAGAIDLPVASFQRGFDIRLFTEAHVFFTWISRNHSPEYFPKGK